MKNIEKIIVLIFIFMASIGYGQGKSDFNFKAIVIDSIWHTKISKVSVSLEIDGVKLRSNNIINSNNRGEFKITIPSEYLDSDLRLILKKNGFEKEYTLDLKSNKKHFLFKPYEGIHIRSNCHPKKGKSWVWFDGKFKLISDKKKEKINTAYNSG